VKIERPRPGRIRIIRRFRSRKDEQVEVDEAWLIDVLRRPTATHTAPEHCPECEGTGTIEACDPFPAMRCHACEPPSEDVLRIVHAFDDQERKDAVRELAARVKATETALATLRQGRESDQAKRIEALEDALRYCRAEAKRHSKTPKAWAPAVIDRVNAALREGSYAKMDARIGPFAPYCVECAEGRCTVHSSGNGDDR
jgi:hypothetical protein